LPTAALVALFAVALALYVMRERRAPEPMIDATLWRSHLISSVNACSLFAGASIIGVTSFVPIYVQGVLGRPALVAGFALTAMSVGWPLASTLSGRFLHALGARNTARVGGALLFAGSLGLSAMPANASAALVGAASFVMGFGMGLLNTTFIILIQGSVEWARRGAATASNIFARMLGSTFGAAILGAVMNASLTGRLGARNGIGIDAVRHMFDGGEGAFPESQREAIHAALATGLSHVFAALAVIGALAMIATWLVPHREVFAPRHEAGPARAERQKAD
jgi:MFS family permease